MQHKFPAGLCDCRLTEHYQRIHASHQEGDDGSRGSVDNTGVLLTSSALKRNQRPIGSTQSNGRCVSFVPAARVHFLCKVPKKSTGTG